MLSCSGQDHRETEGSVSGTGSSSLLSLESIYTLPYLPVLTEVQLCEGGEVSKGLLGDLTTMQIASGT